MILRKPKTIVSICKSFTHEIDASIKAQREVVKSANVKLTEIRKKEVNEMSVISDANAEITSGTNAITNIKKLFGITK